MALTSGERMGGLKEWPGRNGPAQMEQDTSQNRHQHSLKTLTKQSAKSQDSEKGVKTRKNPFQLGGMWGSPPLPSPGTFLFPRWGWEVISNDPRIPFLLFLCFWFLLLGREKIEAQTSATHHSTNPSSSSTLSLSPPLGVAAAVGSSASAGISLTFPASLPLS